MKSKDVVVYLSENEQYLIYKPAQSSLLGCLKRRRTLPIKDIPNLLYGGVTSTFKKHSKANLDLIESRARKAHSQSAPGSTFGQKRSKT